MDMSELAAKMLQWEQLKKQADDLAVEISDAVLEHGETVTVGNVRATFSEPRKKYDYEGTAKRIDAWMLEPAVKAHTQTTTSTNWKKVCEHLEIAEVKFSLQGHEDVRLKLLK